MARRIKARESYQPAPFPSRGEAVLARSDIAALLRITPRTLDKMIGAGQYPRCDFRMPDPEKGDPRWRVATHDAWVRERAGAQETPDESERGDRESSPKRRKGP